MYHWIDILRFCETCHCNIFEACFRMNYIKTNAFNDCHIHLRHNESCIIIILLQHYMFKRKRSFWTTPVDQKSALYNLILTKWCRAYDIMSSIAYHIAIPAQYFNEIPRIFVGPLCKSTEHDNFKKSVRLFCKYPMARLLILDMCFCLNFCYSSQYFAGHHKLQPVDIHTRIIKCIRKCQNKESN